MAHAKERVSTKLTCLSFDKMLDIPRDYNDHKAAQLLGVLSDLLLAEAQFDSWFVDLGFQGCQGDDNSIGGIPCMGVEED